MHSDDEQSIWDIYNNSIISDPNIVWAGRGAKPLPLNTPIHVITACNPFEQLLTDDENHQRNAALYAELIHLKVDINPVVGHSPDGDWQESSFAVHGLTRQQACEIAKHYEQRGIFELTIDELLIIDVTNHQVKRRRAR